MVLCTGEYAANQLLKLIRLYQAKCTQNTAMLSRTLSLVHTNTSGTPQHYASISTTNVFDNDPLVFESLSLSFWLSVQIITIHIPF